MRIFPIVFLLIYSIGYYSIDEVYAQQVDNRLDRLERDIQTLQHDLYAKKGASADTPTSPNQNNSASSSLSGSMAEVRISQLEAQLRQLNGRLETLEHTVKRVELMQKGKSAVSTLQKKTAPTGGAPISITPSMKNRNNPLLAASSVSEAYDSAFALLRKGQYAAAERAFRQFTERYPKEKLTGNALYWLGETYYVQKYYEKASIFFLRGYQEFPTGSKSMDGLLKLGVSLGNLGKKKEACATFSRLYSSLKQKTSPILVRAHQEGKRLGCV